jgi:hypothetical protein
MRFSINLRGDLAKLSDAALVERIENAWQDYEVAARKPRRRGKLAGSWNGPIRHPWAYRFTSAIYWRYGFLAGRMGTIGDFGAASLLGFRAPPEIDMHLTLCEIRDLMDELERRVIHRRELHA